MTDSQLLHSFATSRCADAFSQLVLRHAPTVYAAARRQLPDPSEADDITQAVFLVLNRRAAHLPANIVLSSWLLKATHLACRQARRAFARRHKYEQRAAAMRATSAPAVELSETPLLPVIDKAIASLSDSDRAAILLRYLEQKSVDEISQSLGVSSETAQKRISRAIARLRKALGVGEASISASSLAALFATHGQCPVPEPLLHHLLTFPEAAAATGTGSAAIAISKGVLQTMLWLKMKMIGAAALAMLAIGATGPIVAQQVMAPTAAGAAPTARAALTGKALQVEAELLGLTTQMDGAPITWWAPDGTVLRKAPFDEEIGLQMSGAPDQRALIVALRLKCTPATDVSHHITVPQSSSVGALITGGTDSRIIMEALAVPPNQSSTSVRLNLATGAWKTVISSNGTKPEAAGETPDGDFTVSQIFQDGDSLGVVFADNAVFTMADRRFVARDLNGQEHQPNVADNSAATRSVILRSVKFAGLTQQDVRDIRYDIRPYTDFVEFSNISTQAGAVTKPQVSTGKINPGIIPADKEGPGEYYVGGDVSRVGVYSLTARQITLKQAIISAGLDTNEIGSTEVILIRRHDNDREQIVTADLQALFNGTQPDRFLQPDDVVQIRAKTPATTGSRQRD